MLKVFMLRSALLEGGGEQRAALEASRSLSGSHLPLLVGLAVSEYLQEQCAGICMLLSFRSPANAVGSPWAGTGPTRWVGTKGFTVFYKVHPCTPQMRWSELHQWQPRWGPARQLTASLKT